MKDEKKATRQSYGEALLELGKKMKKQLYLMQIYQQQQRQIYLQKYFPIDFLIWELLNKI